MLPAVYPLQREAGIQPDRQGDVVAGTSSFGRHRRRNLVRIRDQGRGRSPARRRRAGRQAGHVAGLDYHREAELVLAVLPGQGFDVTDGDVDLLAGLDIRDRLSEDVRPFLVQQACDMAQRFRPLVDLASLAPLADLAADSPAAHAHRHAVHRGTFRQRKHVDRFDLLAERVVELLANGDPRHKTRDLRLHVGVFQRAAAQRPKLRVQRFQTPLGSPRIGLGQRSRRDQQQRDDAQRAQHLHQVHLPESPDCLRKPPCRMRRWRKARRLTPPVSLGS